MDLLFPIAGLVLLIGIPVYLHAAVKLGSIVQAEHPEWINRRGSLSFFYTGMPRILLQADSNVDSSGFALMDEFSDTISAYVTELFDGEIKVESIVEVPANA